MLAVAIDLCVLTDRLWLELQRHSDGQIKRPADLIVEMQRVPSPLNKVLLDRIQGSLIGLTLGDALGAAVEFRPHDYMLQNQVTDLQAGGTWGLTKGQVLRSVYSFVLEKRRKKGS